MLGVDHSTGYKVSQGLSGCQLFLGEGIKFNSRFFVGFRESVDRSELAADCRSDFIKGIMARLISGNAAVNGGGGTPLFLLNSQLVFELLELSLLFLDLLQYTLDDRIPTDSFPKPVSPSIEPLFGKGVRIGITLQVSIEFINLLLLSGNGCRQVSSWVPGKSRIIVLLRLGRFVPGFDLFSDLQLDRGEEVGGCLPDDLFALLPGFIVPSGHIKSQYGFRRDIGQSILALSVGDLEPGLSLGLKESFAT